MTHQHHRRKWMDACAVRPVTNKNHSLTHSVPQQRMAWTRGGLQEERVELEGMERAAINQTCR